MNYYKLNLPKNPLKEGFVPKITNEYVDLGSYSQHISWTIYEDFYNILNQETLDLLHSIGLVPQFVIAFGSEKSARDNALIHADVGWDRDRWATIPCAINWELYEVETNYSWYNTDDCVGFWPLKPAAEKPYPLNLLDGLVYVNEFHNLKIATTLEPGKTIVEETATITKEQSPILFNSSKAHSVKYITPGNKRTMISVRFNFDSIRSWEQALEIFSPLIIK